METGANFDMTEVDRAMADVEERGKRLAPAFREARRPLRQDQRAHARAEQGPDGAWPARSPFTEARRQARNRRVRITRAIAKYSLPAVSAAGDRAAIPRGNAVEVYELPGGRLLRTILHSAAVNAVAFAPAGRDLVSGAVDGSALVLHDGGEPIALAASPDGIDVVALLPDGRAVVAAGKRLRVYDAARGTVLAELEAPARTRMLRVAPGGRALVAVARLTKAVPPTLWDLERYRRIAQLEGHVGLVHSARFVRQGLEVLTAGDDGTARLWDGSTGRLRQTYAGGKRVLDDATLSPDGTLVVGGGGDGLLRFWDTAGRQLWTLQAHASPVIGVHFESEAIVTRGLAGDVSRWTLPNLAQVIDACGDRANCAIVSP